MGGVKRHQDLKGWQAAIGLVRDVYALSARFPREKVYGLTGQMRRAAVSSPSNIAEGAARGGTKGFIQFLNIARGSLSELETHVYLPRELGDVPDGTTAIEAKIEELFRILGGLRSSLEKRDR